MDGAQTRAGPRPLLRLPDGSAWIVPDSRPACGLDHRGPTAAIEGILTTALAVFVADGIARRRANGCISWASSAPFRHVLRSASQVLASMALTKAGQGADG